MKRIMMSLLAVLVLPAIAQNSENDSTSLNSAIQNSPRTVISSTCPNSEPGDLCYVAPVDDNTPPPSGPPELRIDCTVPSGFGSECTSFNTLYGRGNGTARVDVEATYSCVGSCSVTWRTSRYGGGAGPGSLPAAGNSLTFRGYSLTFTGYGVQTRRGRVTISVLDNGTGLSTTKFVDVVLEVDNS